MSKPLDKNELPPGSRLSRMKAQFQQKQMQEKEHKLLQMLDNQQQRAMQTATMNGVLPSKYTPNNGFSSTLSTPGSQSLHNYPPTQPGKVRQMFEERRKGGGVGLPSNNLYTNTNGNNSSNSNGSHRNGGIIGIDKSYPLDPLPSKTRSSSSKSDPNPTPTTYIKNARNTVASKPANLGHRRGVSLERPAGTTGSNSERVTPASRGRDRDSSFSSTNGTPGNLSRRASSGLNNYDDVNSNNISRSGHISTKYSEVYGSQDNNMSDSIAKRESNLAMKMKKMNIADDLSSSTEYRSPSVRSTSPLKKSPPPRAARAMPSTPASKPPIAKKTAPAVKRTGPVPPGMAACKICGRCFATDRVEKHETICKKTSTKKRKVFDPTKMRMQGTEAEPYLRRVSAKAPVKAPVAVAAAKGDGSKKSDWRKKHEEFIRTIRAAKEYQAHVAKGGNPADLPPPPPSDYTDYIQCPYCNRKFSEGAAERHIPKCKNIKSNKR